MSTSKYTTRVQEYIGCVVDWDDVVLLPGYLKRIIEQWDERGWKFSHVYTGYQDGGPEFYAVGYRPMNDKERNREEKRISKSKQKKEEEKARTEAEELELLKKLKAKYEK